jgi:hypothetical protein
MFVFLLVLLANLLLLLCFYITIVTHRGNVFTTYNLLLIHKLSYVSFYINKVDLIQWFKKKAFQEYSADNLKVIGGDLWTKLYPPLAQVNQLTRTFSLHHDHSFNIN